MAIKPPASGGCPGSGGGHSVIGKNRRPGLLLGAVAAAAALAPMAASADDASCMRDLKSSAMAGGVAAADFDRVTKGVILDPTVTKFFSNQPEVQLSAADYVRNLVDEKRVADGKKVLIDLKTTFADVEKRFGVPANVLAAIWGIESDYGRAIGKRPVIQSLASLVCAGARATYFRNEFVLAVKIVASGKARPEDMVGSWAGAFGHLQFMPSNFIDDAVDVDGDGFIDLVHSMPDALGSAAMELIHGGWVKGIPWGYEVTVPAGFDASRANRREKRAFAEWARLGVKSVDGKPLPDSGTAGMIIPAGFKGPIFLTTANFDAFWNYNASESYALAVAHLSDRLAGSSGFKTPWPSPSSILSRAEILEVQDTLTQKGFDPGPVDGVAGEMTRAAIGAFEKGLGKPTTGEPTKALLEALRTK
jgi:lytic murein transglycosylase